MKRRIGILTSGGDCPGLNATIRGVAKAVYHKFGDDVQIIGNGSDNGYIWVWSPRLNRSGWVNANFIG